MNDDEPECGCCRSQGIPLKKYSKVALGPRAEAPMLLCEICANSLLSTWMFYPEQQDRTAFEGLKILAYGLNLIRKDLKNK